MTTVDFAATRHTVGDYAVLSVTGEIDVSSAPILRHELDDLRESGATTVIVDLGEIGFLDSTGLGVLVAARSAAEQAGGALPVVSGQERVLKLFAITGLEAIFDLHSTVEDAVAALSS